MELDAECTAEIVKVVRKHLKMGPTEFARAVGCTKQAVWNWEKAIYAPDSVWREAIARTVGIHPDLLWPDPEGSRFNLEAP